MNTLFSLLRMWLIRPVLFLVFLMFFSLEGKAQSPDSRICECLSVALSDNFMDATKAIFGTTGVTVHREEELRPAQNLRVKFVIPAMTPRSGCGAVYKIQVLDKNGLVVYEDEDSQPAFTYAFEQCDSRYEVTVTASVKSPGGNDGNCTRSRHFYVRPVCNNNTCACDPPSSGKNIGTSRNVGLEGKLSCGVITATRRSYTFQYKITNKTNCRMVIESVTVMGQTISGTPTAIVAGGSTTRYNTSISTPLATAAPATGSVNVVVRYKVNDRSCTATIKIVYEPCSQ